MLTPTFLAMGALITINTAAGAAGAGGAPIIDQSFNGIANSQLTPLDANGASGPSSYVEIINSNLAIFSRTGSLISTAPFSTITGNPNLVDPMVLWDADTQRFYYNLFDRNTNHMGWGFSKSSNPRSVVTDFCNFDSSFNYPSPQLTDYPKLGQSKNFLLIGINVYPSLSAQHATHSDLLWISKPQGRAPVTACPAVTSFKTGKFVNLRNADNSQAWTPVPAIQTDPSSTGYVSASSDIECPDICGTGTLITEFAVTPSPTNPKMAVLSAPKSMTVAGFQPPAKAPQKGSTLTLDTLDGRLEHSVSGMDPRFHKTAVWVEHSVKGGAGSEARWYEIDPVAGNVLQSGKVSDSRLYIFNAAISTDRTVNPTGAAHGSAMVMSLTTSSATTFATSAMVAKIGAAAQSPIVIVHASTKADTDFSCTPTCRWGDYAGATADPAASLTAPLGNVWCTNEWTDGTNRSWNWEATP